MQNKKKGNFKLPFFFMNFCKVYLAKAILLVSRMTVILT